ncbi:zinc finger MYM-type protein 1-like [Acyrthosiphon pisum]|uniref:DUF4371 domain-containing protein n=1 Tax=Acyrthosiphon pisum TaxID=7029 RepID=A0A8R2JU29_ACYPI|nr:zinc finger MYM-type protein 1-like [Acyrthosiphon pisum]XP_029346326.1 zinc finger MYM-type protein 1-like [Acyrthosiphon pisum]
MYSKDTNYSSWRIQNELIDICASSIKEIILNEISTTGFFAIMCDEARSYKEEQLSLCVRYAVGLNVFERFLDFIDVSSGQNATQIYSAIMHYFEEQTINMEIVHIIAQSYDGASVMSGHLNGVQSKVQKQYPAAIFTHCMARQLNLVVVDLCKSIKVINFKRK